MGEECTLIALKQLFKLQCFDCQLITQKFKVRSKSELNKNVKIGVRKVKSQNSRCGECCLYNRCTNSRDYLIGKSGTRIFKQFPDYK